MTDKVVYNQRIIINIDDKSGLNSEVASLCDIIVYSPSVFEVEEVSGFLQHAKTVGVQDRVYLNLPVVANHEDIKILKNILSLCKFAGVLADNLYAVSLAQEFDLNFIAGMGLNIYNGGSAGYFTQLGGDFIYSAELSLKEIVEVEKKLDKQGFVFAYGDMRAMTLCHCPVQLITDCNCKTCQYSPDLSYVDDKGYKFPIKRLRVNRCYFELYNGAKINAIPRLKNRNFNAYFVLFKVSASRICDIIKSYRFGTELSQNSNDSFTTGHLFKGVK